MTIPQIIASVSKVAGAYSLSSFHRDRRKLKIQPTGFRQKPQQYPHTAVASILTARGFETALAPLPPLDTAAARLASLPSMSELRRARKAARNKHTGETTSQREKRIAGAFGIKGKAKR